MAVTLPADGAFECFRAVWASEQGSSKKLICTLPPAGRPGHCPQGEFLHQVSRSRCIFAKKSLYRMLLKFHTYVSSLALLA
jgi:hypothetical protein